LEENLSLANQGMMLMYDQFMQRAIALAIENAKSGSGGPFAAVVAKDGRIIAEGTNRVTSANDPSAHAEIVAIREACRALGDFQLIARCVSEQSIGRVLRASSSQARRKMPRTPALMIPLFTRSCAGQSTREKFP
jgi:tRNA(Arg) A34 adenosine deaminase TadA